MIKSIKKESIQSLPALQYSLIIDGTQDVSGIEQESICFRYVDHDIIPHGVEIARVAADVLLRLNIPMSGLRGQTYDGAPNMSGRQAELKRQQPLALYVHST